MKLFISSFFSLFAILFFLSAGGAGEKTHLGRIDAKPIKDHSKHETTDSLTQSNDSVKNIGKQNNCEVSGQAPVYSKHYKLKSPFHFANRIDDWVDESLSYIKKDTVKWCPESCEQINSYQVSSKIYPQTVIKGSCKEEESKETYAFKKKFIFDKNKKSVKKTHKEMTEWILATFVYPYFPIPFLEPTKESIEHNISKACPSCSFYLDYTYIYTKDKTLELDIKANCGDVKKFMFDFKAEFALVNHWSCKKLGEVNPSEEKESSSEQKTLLEKESALEQKTSVEQEISLKKNPLQKAPPLEEK